MSESFSAPTSSLAGLGAYAYRQYSIDAAVQAFFSSQNALSQGYLDWFNNTPLALYTSPNITGPLLDWIGQGIYGIPRPVLTTQTILRLAGNDAFPNDAMPNNALLYSQSGTATIASDDIYKRVMTWNTYKGDGQVFNLFWLKNRVNRFLNGANGSDYTVLQNPPAINVSGSTFTIQATSAAIYTTLAQCIANGVLALPFQYTFIVGSYLSDNGGVLDVAAGAGWPTTTSGLVAGNVWNDGGVGAVFGTTTPNPAAPAVYLYNTTAAQLLTLGGANLPLSNPGPGTQQLWNNHGVISVA